MLRRYPVLGAVPAGQALAGYQRGRILTPCRRGGF